jgi:hypothetical protein
VICSFNKRLHERISLIKFITQNDKVFNLLLHHLIAKFKHHKPIIGRLQPNFSSRSKFSVAAHLVSAIGSSHSASNASSPSHRKFYLLICSLLGEAFALTFHRFSTAYAPNEVWSWLMKGKMSLNNAADWMDFMTTWVMSRFSF